MRVVLDTNVFVSALLWGGVPGRVVDLAVSGRFRVITSPELLAELERALVEHFAVSRDRMEMVLRDILSYAEVTIAIEEVQVPLRDHDDRMVVACAVSGRVDCIVTGDRDLLVLGEVHGVAVVTVRELLTALA